MLRGFIATTDYPRSCQSLLVDLPAGQKRIDEVIELLRSHAGPSAAADLAELLIRQNRAAEAVVAIPGVAAQREDAQRRWGTWSGEDAGSTDELPFGGP
ncbi:hypothetical protein OG782_00475 [Streptomyces sp. NBC_00876]|uniref:hypothetical protein n=1 Tax=Streptomyces sp. NBC_00876 TaxID=2975853 RepID=UPI00386B6C67|nr:hypothetical protein OG782_00475 [Streptomyces sp. NBC_00876]